MAAVLEHEAVAARIDLPRDFWSAELRFSRYTVEKFTEREYA